MLVDENFVPRLRASFTMECYLVRLKACEEKGFTTAASSPNSHAYIASLAVADADAVIAELGLKMPKGGL